VHREKYGWSRIRVYHTKCGGAASPDPELRSGAETSRGGDAGEEELAAELNAAPFG
jgi:hypothetical protein